MANGKLGSSYSRDYAYVEQLDSDKTLKVGDSGKIFMVVQSASAIAITLPGIDTIQPGWKAKFILKTASSADFVIGCTSGDGNVMVGLICSADGSAGESAESAVDEFTFIGGKSAAGDWGEIEFDGDLFYVSGQEHDADHLSID